MLGMTEFYYFSPTGGTKKTGEIFCSQMAEQVIPVDLGGKNTKPKQPESGLVVIAAPVFGGRIPSVATERLKTLNGTDKKAVTLAVYGTRAYEDALLELNQTAEAQGFQVVASAALIAQHSIVPEVGKGRPDEKDREEIENFAAQVLEKLAGNEAASVTVPGNEPYKAAMQVMATPISTPGCTHCGACAAVCPTSAITVTKEEVATNKDACLLCMACTAACPEHARILPPPMQEGMEQKLGALKAVRRENEFFL